MAWEFDGLFDSLRPETEDLTSAFWTREATAIRVGTMGYRTATTKAGTRLEAEIYPIFGRQKETQLREKKRNRTPERVKEQNMIRSKRRLVLMLENNFDYWKDVAVTLTYAEKDVTLKRCRADIRNFILRVRRERKARGLADMKWILAIGYDEQQQIHAHMVLNGGIDRTDLERIWGHGYANTYALQTYGKGLQGIGNYLYKQNESAKRKGLRENVKCWSGSRNLKKPKERVSDSKFSKARIKNIAYDFENEAKAITERTYPGYTLEECRVYYSDMIDGVYIRCVMRRMGGFPIAPQAPFGRNVLKEERVCGGKRGNGSGTGGRSGGTGSA